MIEDLEKRPSLMEKFEKFISLGLWPENMAQPDPQILERIQKLNDEIENRIYELYLPDEGGERIIKNLKKEMYQESLQRKKEQASVEKEKSKNRVQHLGSGVSSWLSKTKQNTKLLKKQNLTVIETPKKLSKILEVSLKQLQWFSYHRKVSTWTNYSVFKVPKVSGGYRKISRPNRQLSEIQQKIKSKILDKITFPEYIMGFRKDISIYDNARKHAKGDIIVNIDIEDFFDNIRFYQVRSALNNLGYSGQISTIIGLLVTKQRQNLMSIEDKTKYSFSDERHLPQGACTSPQISNLVGRKIDDQIKKRSEKIGFKYTRYADDLTFSTKEGEENINQLLYMVRKSLEMHGFKANPQKTVVMFPEDQQKVTGLIVNSGNPKVPRKWRRKLRAAVHQFQFIEDEEEIRREYFRIKGCLEFLRFSHPQKVHQYDKEIDRHFKDLE